MPAARASDYSKNVIQEGRAKVVVYEAGPIPTKKMPVFYNPRMIINRNFSVLAVHALQAATNKPIIVCDPMAGSGIRAVRFALETPRIKVIHANDINPAACRQMVGNLLLNDIPPARVKISSQDANVFFLQNRGEKFDYIDIDPFGSPIPFLYNAFRAVTPGGGMLGVTATDTAVLHGAHADACVLKYAAQPLRAPFLKELGARILIQYIFTVAASVGYGIDPAIVLSEAHFVKVFARVKRSKTLASQNLAEIGWVHFCPRCWNLAITKCRFPHALPGECSKCGEPYDTAGPAWLGSMYDPAFLRTMGEFCQKQEYFPEWPATLKLLDLMEQDSQAPMFGIHIHKLCDRLAISSPPFDYIQHQLSVRGFRSFRSHFDPLIIKTTAPLAEVEEILKEAPRPPEGLN